MVKRLGIQLVKEALGLVSKEMHQPVHVFEFPTGPLCRGYHNRLLHEGIFFRLTRRLFKVLSTTFRMNPFYWVLKLLLRVSLYPLWRWVRYFVYKQQVQKGAGSLKTNKSERKTSLGNQGMLREVVQAQLHTSYKGCIRLQLWRHKNPDTKVCVICFPNPSVKGVQASCFWPLEEKELPCHWVQFDYRKMGQSKGQACRFEEVVDDAQAVMMYAKAFIGAKDSDFIFIAEGIGALIAQSLSERFPLVEPYLFRQNLKKITFSSEPIKRFLIWLMGWPAWKCDKNFKEAISFDELVSRVQDKIHEKKRGASKIQS